MNVFRIINGLLLGLESVLIGCKIVFHGSHDISFTTQAMRLLMFCARYSDLHWIRDDPSMRLFLLLSTLFVVVLLGYNKCSQATHKNITPRTISEVIAILLFSTVLGAIFMYLPTIPEFIWAFSRFIDAVLEVPQLKRVYISEELDKWIVAYYCCIGSRVVFYVISAVYRYQNQYVFDVITAGTTLLKGIIVAVFFIARSSKRRERSIEDQEGNPSQI